MSRKPILLAVAVCSFALVLAQGRVEAQSEAFKISGAGQGPHGLPGPGEDAQPHWAIGVGTHLGKYCGEGSVQTDSLIYDPTTGTFTGEFGSGSPFVFTGANGDELVCWYGRTDHGASEPGTFTLTIVGALSDGTPIVEAAWVAEFVAVPDESTGKFAGVNGSWVMYAFSAPFVLGSDDPVDYWWHGEGRLTFAHGRGHGH